MPDIDVTETVQNDSHGQLAVGSTFAGRYEIIGVLGQGGMSTVYKARQVVMDRVVALKVMHAWMLKEASSYQRFQREAQAASQLNHPNIVKVHSFGTDGQQPFIVMDFIEGQSFAAVLAEKKKVTADELLAVVIPAAKALSHAHSQGLVHRDIKPANIMLDKEKKVYLVDFGVAKAIDGTEYAQQLTQTNGVVGTPYYMSPEQCERAELDPRSDMYSLGCVLYEALAGAVPFPGDSPFAVMYSHIHETAAALPSSVPAWLSNTIMRMLEKKREDRFENMDDVVAILEKSAPPHMVLRRPAKRTGQKIPKLLLPAIVFAAVIGGSAYWHFVVEPERARPHELINAEELNSVDAAMTAAREWMARYKKAKETDPNKKSYSLTAGKCYARAVVLAKQLPEEKDNPKIVIDIYWDKAKALGAPEGSADADLSIRQLVSFTVKNSDQQKLVRELVERYKYWKAEFHPSPDAVMEQQMYIVTQNLRGSIPVSDQIEATRSELARAQRQRNHIQILSQFAALINLQAYKGKSSELHKALIEMNPVVMSAKAGKDSWQDQVFLNQALGCIGSNWFPFDREKALAVRSRCIQLNEEFFGVDAPETAQMRIEKAGLLGLMGRLKEAEALIRPSVAILVNDDSRTDPHELLESAVSGYTLLAGFALAKNDPATAAKHYAMCAQLAERLEVLDRRPDHNRPANTLAAYEALSDAYQRAADYAKAGPAASHAIELALKIKPPKDFIEHPQLAMIVAQDYLLRNQPNQAEAVLAEACARTDKYNLRTLHSAWAYGQRGQIAESQRRFEDALHYYQRSKAIWQQIIRVDKRWGTDLTPYNVPIVRVQEQLKAKNAT
jgi:serine/threonine protein kinase